MTIEDKYQNLLALIRTVHKYHDLEDAVYHVRDHAVENGQPFEGSSWDHPDVVAYGEAIDELLTFIEEK